MNLTKWDDLDPESQSAISILCKSRKVTGKSPQFSSRKRKKSSLPKSKNTKSHVIVRHVWMTCHEQFDQIQLHSSRKPKKIGITWKGLDKMEVNQTIFVHFQIDYG